MVDFWIKNDIWQKKSTTGKSKRSNEEDFMVYHEGARSMAAHKEAMDRETGRDNCWADLYLKVHTDPGASKPHPTIEARMDTYRNKRLASMRASGIEIPMKNSSSYPQRCTKI